MSEEMSKSAKKRANKKARDAEAAGEAAAPAPAPKAAAAKPKAAAPKAKAAAEPKAEAKAKAKAKSEPKAAAAAPKQEPKAAPKQAASKAKAKAKAAKEEPVEEPKKEAAGPLVYFEMDDGSRKDEWETAAGVSKKKAKQLEKQAEQRQLEKATKAGEVLQARGGQHIPGLAPTSVQLAQGKAGAKANASQSVTAFAAVSATAADDKGTAKKAAAPDNNVSTTIKVPENKIGWIVGPKGANIKLIQEKCNLKTLDMSGDECTLIGLPDAVAMAETAIRQLMEKGFMSLSYEDYAEDGVMLHPSIFPDIIGSKGAIIMEIKKQAKCEVNIPAVAKNGPASKKYRVSLAGSKASVQLGTEILNSIALYGHHPLTHPGVSHMELEIEAWKYPFIIGSKGSELRHIQNNYRVKVSIPREHSANQNVVLVGEERDIERAKKYIDKILDDSEQPRGRGAQEKAEDTWGDEGEVEDWMKPYMYQRK